MTSVGPVIARMRAAAPRETTWAYLVDAELRRDWWPDLTLDAQLGGAVAEQWSEGEGSDAVSRDAHGVVDVMIVGHALGFRWRDGADDVETAVLVTLRSFEEETEVLVTETGFGRFPDAFERTADAQQSWIELLTQLTKLLEDAELVSIMERLDDDGEDHHDTGDAAAVRVEPADTETEKTGFDQLIREATETTAE